VTDVDGSTADFLAGTVCTVFTPTRRKLNNDLLLLSIAVIT